MISKRTVTQTALLLFGISLLILEAAAQKRPAAQPDPMSNPAVQMITGPYTHENLAIFLLHGKDQLPEKHYLTLGEALAQKKAVVYETSQVNELMVENQSNEEIFIQSGDIVKGGKQDRTLGYDLILPPHSGKIRIISFCVEHGRWQARGSEKSAEFNSSEQRLAGKELKIAAIAKNDQSEVWRNVTVVQNKLSTNLNTSVNAPQSASSLQLSLENRKVRESVDDYMRALLPIVEKKNGIIGFAFAVNGIVNSGDIYATHALFLKMWPKLLKSSAVEAIAEMTVNKNFKPATPAMVSAGIKDAEKGKRSEKAVSSRIRIVTSETEKNLLIETKDQAKNEQWIHKSYIQK